MLRPVAFNSLRTGQRRTAAERRKNAFFHFALQKTRPAQSLCLLSHRLHNVISAL
jgi:hypothetical protein